MTKFVLAVISVVLAGCAGMNPNPGERTADTNWERGNYSRAVEVARSSAELGYPWAQLRMGIYYNAGQGVAIDIPQAVEWYKKAARQLAEGKWAEGYIVGATGEYGYFGQRNDALIAMYRLADIYFQGEGVNQNLILSYLLINSVIKDSKGEPQVFFCCDWSGGRWFRQTQFTELKVKLEGAMSEEQLAKARDMAATWNPKTDL
jgi:hypothetical protein